MGDGGFQWKLFLFIALALPALFSTVLPCPQCYRTDIFLSSYLEGNETYVNATLIATTQEYHATIDSEKLLEQYRKTVEGDPTAAEGSIGEFETGGDIFPLAGEKISFLYYGYEADPETGQTTRKPVEISGCTDLETDALGLAACQLPREIYEDRCIQVFGQYRGSAVYYPSQAFTMVCDDKATFFGSFGSVLGAYLDPSNSVCLMSMVILGLLLASMFFTGRSPLSLLDITTPLLPKAKSIHYGSILYTRGYMKLGRALQDNVKMTGKALSQSTKALLNRLTGEDKKMALELLAKNKNANPAMVYLALRSIKGGKYKDAKKLIKVDPAQGKEEELEEISRKFKELSGARGGKPDVELETAWNHVGAHLQLKLMSPALGNLPSWMGKVNKFVRDRVPWVGPQLSAATGSMAVGMRQVGRFYKGLAMGTLTGIDVATKGKLIGRMEKATKSRPATTGEKVRQRMVSGVLGFYRKEEKRVQTFKIMNIEPREEQLYHLLNKEAKANVLIYLLKRYMKSQGVDPELSQEETLNIYELKILKRMHLKKLGADGDALIREILGKDGGSMEDKIARLSAVLKERGVFFDESRINSVLARLKQIEDSSIAGAAKYQQLMEYLREGHRVDVANLDFRREAGASEDRDRFYFLLGRDKMSFDLADRSLYDDTWTFMFLRSLIEQGEQGNLEKNRASVFDVAKLTWLKLTNEMFGLVPSSTKGLDAQLGMVMRQAETYLKSLLSGQGLDAYKRMQEEGLMQGLGPDQVLLDMLYSPEVAKVSGGVAREYGPDPEHWKLDVKGFWNLLRPVAKTDVGTLARTSVAQEAREMSAGGYIQKEAALHPSQFHFAKGDLVQSTYAHKFFFSRIKDIVGTRYPNAYFHTNDEHNFLSYVREGYRDYYCRRNGIDRSYLNDLHGVEAANLYLDKRMREEGFMKRDVNFRELGEGTWLKVREGVFIPYVHGMPVSDAEFIVNGRLSVRKNGQWAEFHPEDPKYSWRMLMPQLKDEQARKLGAEAVKLFKGIELREEGEPPEYTHEERLRDLAARVKAWGIRTKNEHVAASMLYDISSALGNFRLLEESGLARIRPRSETTSGKTLLGKFSLAFSRGWESAMMSTFLTQTKQMFDIASNSEYYRDRVNRLSASIARGDFHQENPDVGLVNAYEKVNQSIRRYHTVWDDVITRDPRGNTSAVGSQFIFASYFHHGPAVHFDPYWNVDALKGRKGEFWERLRTAPLGVNWLIGSPFVLAYRGMQTAQYGYPTRQDKSFNPTHNWSFTAPRTLEGIRSFASPFYSALDFSAGTYKRSAGQLSNFLFGPMIGASVHASRIMDGMPESVKNGWPMGWLKNLNDKVARHEDFANMGEYDDAAYRPYYVEDQRISEKFQGPIIRRNFGGRELRMGLKRTHEDSQYILKNVNVIWGNANPGASYLDFEHNLRIDPKLAIHLSSASKFSSFYAHDDYIRKQANVGTIRRQVSALQLAAEREIEQRHYGETLIGAAKHNPLTAWVNPLGFFYYGGGVPLLANLSVHNLYENRYKSWKAALSEKKMEYAALDKFEQKNYIRGQIASTVYSAPRKAGSWIARHVGIGEYPNPFSTTYKYCRRCGSPQEAGRMCPVCSKTVSCPSCGTQVKKGTYHSCPAKEHKPLRVVFNPKTGEYETRGASW